MILLYVLFIFICVYGVNLFFNKRRNGLIDKERYLLTFLEAFVVTLFIYYTTLVALANSFIIVFALFIIMVITQYFRFTDDRMKEGDNDLKLEAMKNSFLFVNITVVPFLIGLTMFRFLPFFVQIPLSIIVGISTYFLSKGIQKVLSKVFTWARFKINFDGSRKYVYGWMLFGLIGFSFYFFNFPTAQVKDAFHLDNHKPIVSFSNGYDLDLKNHYETELILEWETPYSSEASSNDDGEDSPSTFVFYDYDNDITYQAYINASNKTVYTKTYLNGDVEEYVINGRHNLQGYVLEGVVYLFGEESEVIEIMDGEFRINHIINIYPLETFLEMNNYYDFYVDYRVSGNRATVTTTNIKGDTNYHSSYAVVKHDVDLDLPFYTHFTLYHTILIFICMLWPITDWKKYVTVVDFKSVTNSKK